MSEITFSVTLFLGWIQKQRMTESAGFVSLWNQARLICLGLPNVLVSLHSWDASVDDVAEFQWRFRPRNGIRTQHHIVAGYSYGGDRANKFCKALSRRSDVLVDQLWLCDPVRRWDYLPGVAAPFGLGRIVVPPNVGEVITYRQQNPRWDLDWPIYEPAGHEVVAKDKLKTRVNDPVTAYESHIYIDNNSGFHSAFLGSVKRMVERAKGALTA